MSFASSQGLALNTNNLDVVGILSITNPQAPEQVASLSYSGGKVNITQQISTPNVIINDAGSLTIYDTGNANLASVTFAGGNLNSTRPLSVSGSVLIKGGNPLSLYDTANTSVASLTFAGGSINSTYPLAVSGDVVIDGGHALTLYDTTNTTTGSLEYVNGSIFATQPLASQYTKHDTVYIYENWSATPSGAVASLNFTNCTAGAGNVPCTQNSLSFAAPYFACQVTPGAPEAALIFFDGTNLKTLFNGVEKTFAFV
jgi:hypothetical protein